MDWDPGRQKDCETRLGVRGNSWISQKTELEAFVLDDPAIQRGRKEHREDYRAGKVHERKRNLAYERRHERLLHEERAYHHRHRVVDHGRGDAEEEEILDGSVAILKKEMRRDAEEAVAYSRHCRPASPPARNRVIEDYAKETKKKTPDDTVAF